MSAAPSPPSPALMPVGFVAHGAPTLALDPARGAPLSQWAQAMARPSALLVLSAHWEQAPITIGTVRSGALMYDFYGFPKPLYDLRYDAPSAAALAERVASLLRDAGPVAREDRALDHGVWVPLLHMYPQADLPVLQVSLPTRQGPAALIKLGQALSALRAEGVLILGSGNLVHNLRRLDFSESTPPPSWALEFDQWVAQAILSGDLDALADVSARAPGASLAHPTLDHYLPLLPVIAAAQGAGARFTLEGFEYGSISRRCVQWG